MGPKMAINLFSIGVGATILLIAEGVISGALAQNVPFILIAVSLALVGGVRILQIRGQRKI